MRPARCSPVIAAGIAIIAVVTNHMPLSRAAATNVPSSTSR
jgi:hypothetical protein